MRESGRGAVSFVAASKNKTLGSSMDARRNDHGTAGGETPTVLPENQARQGVTGHNVRYVLTAGIAGVVILFALLYAYYF
jgi:hypothetical protein